MTDQVDRAARQTHWPTKTVAQLMLGLKAKNCSALSPEDCPMEKHVSPACTPCTFRQLSVGTAATSETSKPARQVSSHHEH